MTPEQQAALDAVLRTDFPSFLDRCYTTLNPGRTLLWNWHIPATANCLEEVRVGKITRLIVNLPPRYLKSIMVSVAFPAFLLGHDPTRRIFGISYGSELSSKHARDFRSIIESDWYKRIFPATKIERMAGDDVETTAGGFRRATSIYASLTGFGGDTFIIDDPQKAIEAQSEHERNKLHQWPPTTLFSRLDNKKTGTIVLVMQRLHQQDLTGYFLESSDEWYLLSLPAIAEADEIIPLGGGRFYRRKAGEALHPEHEPLATLERLKTQMGSEAFSAQYQQQPVPPGGGMIRRKWLRYYDRPPERTYRSKIIQSWDTAAKAGAQNDWSVCTTWILHENVYYLLDVTRGRYDYPQLKAIAIASAQRHRPDVILIEDASTGTALAQEMNASGLGLAVRLVPIERDKVGRLYVQQARFEAGLVVFPRAAAFLADIEAELLTFPQGRHDDQVDSLSQALAHQTWGYTLDNVR